MNPDKCVYHTPDGGCRKSFISCPQIVDDVCELGCGGAGWELDPVDLIPDFNERLKNLKSYDDLINLENDMNKVGAGLVFRMKRSLWCAYSFTEHNGKIHYLLSDSVSTRECSLKNLYKYIEVSNCAR